MKTLPEVSEEASPEDYDNPNAALIRSIDHRTTPDWDGFFKAQEPHRKAYNEMIRGWKKVYSDSEATFAEREQAGINLGYGEFRRTIHETIGRLLLDFNQSSHSEKRDAKGRPISVVLIE